MAAVADVLAGCEADNVWYAEIYVCPTQHTNGDLDIAGVIDACLSGPWVPPGVRGCVEMRRWECGGFIALFSFL